MTSCLLQSVFFSVLLVTAAPVPVQRNTISVEQLRSEFAASPKRFRNKNKLKVRQAERIKYDLKLRPQDEIDRVFRPR